MKKSIIENAEIFVRQYFESKDGSLLSYHNISHTEEVVKAVKKIAIKSELNEDDLELVLLAAWFHDTGYIDSRTDHEQKSAEIAEIFLNEQNYLVEKIKIITNCILSTKIPQKPTTILEQIICDADMRHLAKKDFIDRSELLKLECENCADKSISKIEWFEETLKFMKSHQYFTDYAKKKFTGSKLQNISLLEDHLDKLKTQNHKYVFKEEKLKIEKQRLLEKQESTSKSDRGIETMFRNVIRTHVEFSAMADNKANIMISVNTLVLTAIIAILARKLDSNPHLIIPTIILTLVSLSTLIFATFVTRPKITDGVFTEDDINKKRTNLLFFGNFYKMGLDKFTWGMREMMKDKDFLYGNMIMDFYYLGQVLGKKYKYLNICYGIFIYGLIISVIVFAIAIFITQAPTNFGPLID